MNDLNNGSLGELSAVGIDLDSSADNWLRKASSDASAITTDAKRPLVMIRNSEKRKRNSIADETAASPGCLRDPTTYNIGYVQVKILK
jgi:hypothetical protein